MIDSPKLLGVMGWPIGHSLSPRLHGYWISHYKLNAYYVPLPIKPDNIAEAIRAMPKLGFIGANVTIPHKEAAFKLADSLTDEARHIGAVNTLIMEPDGTIQGANTDAYGFAENLRVAGCAIADGPALVLGAGGAARAVLTALAAHRCPQIFLTNRSIERALALAAMIPGLPVQVIPWERRDADLSGTQLVINTTSLGMTGQESLSFDLTKLPADASVCDLVYKPLTTPLLNAAAARGLRAIDGLGMLLFQAQASFNHWFGIRPEVTKELRDYVLSPF